MFIDYVTVYEITWCAIGNIKLLVLCTDSITTTPTIGSEWLTEGILCIKHCLKHFLEIHLFSQQPYEVGAIIIMSFTLKEIGAERG